MTSLRQRMIGDMQVRNFSPHTQASYVQQVALFARLSDSKLNATESPKLFATEKKSRDIIVLLLE